MRCRLGLHRWSRFRVADPDMAAGDYVWETRCRDCSAPQTAGEALSTMFFLLVAIVAVVAFFALSPLLGAVLFIGAVAGIGWAMGPKLLGRAARFLSTGR